MSLAELVRNSAGLATMDEDGDEETLELLPPLRESEIAAFETKLPCALPDDVRKLLGVARGFKNGPLETFEWVGDPDFGLDWIFPHGLPIAHDGFGNYWVVDLISDSTAFGPIFYVCHDAPVVVYQSADFGKFIEEFLRFANPPHESEIDQVHERFTDTIWRNNPNVMSCEECLASADEALRHYAETLDDSYDFFDLRSANIGDGFPWGRYVWDPDVACRCGEARMFAFKRKKGLVQRLFGR